MNARIFTRVINLYFDRDKGKVSMGKSGQTELLSLQEEVLTFTRDKKEVSITWLQSIGSAAAMGFGAVSVSFTQLTAIVTW